MNRHNFSHLHNFFFFFFFFFFFLSFLFKMGVEVAIWRHLGDEAFVVFFIIYTGHRGLSG